jgi:hypothetical protein
MTHTDTLCIPPGIEASSNAISGGACFWHDDPARGGAVQGLTSAASWSGWPSSLYSSKRRNERPGSYNDEWLISKRSIVSWVAALAKSSGSS